ncbi:MAG: response regulator [Thermosynechococcaceae cyanobacterium]
MLVEDQILTAEQAENLVNKLSREALEHLLMVQERTYRFASLSGRFSQTDPIDFDRLLQDCQQRIQGWKALDPYIDSPYQRPYLFSQSHSVDKLSSEQRQRLGKLLKGFSFRHLALLLDQDELKLIKSLYPLVLDKTILLRDPQPPYHDLPTFSKASCPDEPEVAALFASEFSDFVANLDQISQSAAPTKTYRVACVDDSPAMLQTIERFLDQDILSLFLVQDSVKALVEMMRIKPDLIVLDVGMPKVDGYELCRLLRKHPVFKSTPIIMVTDNTGLIDRARAKVAGATDYVTKPFTQAELQKIVFRHLA